MIEGKADCNLDPQQHLSKRREQEAPAYVTPSTARADMAG